MLTVGAIVCEPLETTLKFVSWYLEQDADQIVLCFDNPNDPAIAVLEGHEKVRCIPCKRQFWLGIGVRPRRRFTLRQNAAMQHVYDGLTKGWFLNVDGDELVHLEGRTLRQEVLQQPRHVKAVRIRPAERIQSSDGSDTLQFRTAMPRWCCRSLYGDLAHAMQFSQGMCGHRAGKSVTRVGLKNHTVRQHFLQTPEEVALSDVILGPADGAYVLHFLDQGFDIWRSKLEWRIRSRGFRQKMKFILQEALENADPEPTLREIYDKLHVFDPERLAVLGRADSLFAVDLDLDGVMARHFATECESEYRLVA